MEYNRRWAETAETEVLGTWWTSRREDLHSSVREMSEMAGGDSTTSHKLCVRDTTMPLDKYLHYFFKNALYYRNYMVN